MEFFKSRYFYIGLLFTLVTVGAFLLGISFRFHLFNVAFWVATGLFWVFSLYELGAIFWKPLGCLLPVIAFCYIMFSLMFQFRTTTIKRWSRNNEHIELYIGTTGFMDSSVEFDIYETIGVFPVLESYVGTAEGMDAGVYCGQAEKVKFYGFSEEGLICHFSLSDSIVWDTIQIRTLDYSRYF